MACKGTTTTQFGVEYSSVMAMQPSPASETALEVTVVSAEEVRLECGKALCGRAYAVVHSTSASARTRVDEDRHCNGYPYWRDTLRVKVPERTPAIEVEIFRTKSDGRVESVAAARVPVEDFRVGPLGHLHCLSYRLFDSGSRLTRRNGVVNITVKRLADASGAHGNSQAPSQGRTVVDNAACGSSGSRCGAADGGNVPSAAPAGAVMGYPVAFSGNGNANGKGTV